VPPTRLPAVRELGRGIGLPRAGRDARDTGRVMSEESAIDLVALARRSIEAESIDAAVSFYAPDAVWDASPWGMGVFEGQTAVRGFFDDWSRSYTDIKWRLRSFATSATE
jgi:SnoaL-like domain